MGLIILFLSKRKSHRSGLSAQTAGFVSLALKDRICANIIILALLFITLVNSPWIYAQWSNVPDSGVAVGIGAGRVLYPNIVSDGAGGAIIAGGGGDIYAQRVNASGIMQWGINGAAICTTANNQDYPDLVSDGVGGAIVAWEDGRSGGVYKIYVERINASGEAQWLKNGIPVCTAVKNQMYPTIASDDSGGAIIVWEDHRDTNDIYGNQLYAQRISSGGEVRWNASGAAICTARNVKDSWRIVTDGAGGAIIVWSDYRSGADFDIYAQRINSSGVVQWMTDGIPVCTTIYNQEDPVIVSDKMGGAILAWSDYRSGTNYDVYGQHVRAEGVEQWTVDGIPICTEPNNQFVGAMVGDMKGGAIITWEDYRTGTKLDIYAQRFTSS